MKEVGKMLDESFVKVKNYTPYRYLIPLLGCMSSGPVGIYISWFVCHLDVRVLHILISMSSSIT